MYINELNCNTNKPHSLKFVDTCSILVVGKVRHIFKYWYKHDLGLPYPTQLSATSAAIQSDKADWADFSNIFTHFFKLWYFDFFKHSDWSTLYGAYFKDGLGSRDSNVIAPSLKSEKIVVWIFNTITNKTSGIKKELTCYIIKRHINLTLITSLCKSVSYSR